ncbi:MAG: FtsX-like permease family protein [Pseudonocardia sp.]|nr:FtsX-like permease family protein [Pseudonocardia sp.]
MTERTRETGLLRAVGLTRRGVRAMVAWEAALSGTGAAAVGVVAVAVLAAVVPAARAGRVAPIRALQDA